jgi:hypothetical protein
MTRTARAIKVGDAESCRVEEMPIKSPMRTLTKDQALIDGDVFHDPLQILYPELHMPGYDSSDAVRGLGASQDPPDAAV